jgi:hypothetical protein
LNPYIDGLDKIGYDLALVRKRKESEELHNVKEKYETCLKLSSIHVKSK